MKTTSEANYSYGYVYNYYFPYSYITPFAVEAFVGQCFSLNPIKVNDELNIYVGLMFDIDKCTNAYQLSAYSDDNCSFPIGESLTGEITDLLTFADPVGGIDPLKFSFGGGIWYWMGIAIYSTTYCSKSDPTNLIPYPKIINQ